MEFKDAFIPVYDQMATPAELLDTFVERTGVKARCACCRFCCAAYSALTMHAEK